MTSTRRDRPTDAGDHIDEPGVVQGERGASALASPEDLPPRLRRRRAFTLLGLTLAAPGTAQLVAGNPRLGRIALRVWGAVLAVVVVTAVAYALDRALVVNLGARPLVLTGLAWMLVGLAAGWAVLFVDTLRLIRLPLIPPSTRRWVGAATCVLILLTSGTLAFGARSVFVGRDAVEGIFGGNLLQGPSDGRYNVLLLGADSGSDQAGLRPDTIMLASVDADTGRSALFGFARDTENIDFRPGSVMAGLLPEGWNCGDACLLNALYTWGEENAARFPAGTKDPGALATTEAVEALSGLDIQYYALVDIKGFQRLIDAVGGVDLTVGRRTPIGGGTSPVTGWIEPGEQHLDGYHALWYARSREGSSNYERMARQRCVTTAMLHQLSPQNVILKFQDVADVAGSTLTTSIPDADLGTLADLAVKARSHPIRSVNFVPPTIKPWDYDPQVIRDKVTQTIESSASDPPTAPRPAPSPTGQSPTPTVRSTDTPGDATSDGAGTGSPTEGADESDLTSVCAAR